MGLVRGAELAGERFTSAELGCAEGSSLGLGEVGEGGEVLPLSHRQIFILEGLFLVSPASGHDK